MFILADPPEAKSAVRHAGHRLNIQRRHHAICLLAVILSVDVGSCVRRECVSDLNGHPPRPERGRATNSATPRHVLFWFAEPVFGQSGSDVE